MIFYHTYIRNDTPKIFASAITEYTKIIQPINTNVKKTAMVLIIKFIFDNNSTHLQDAIAHNIVFSFIKAKVFNKKNILMTKGFKIFNDSIS